MENIFPLISYLKGERKYVEEWNYSKNKRTWNE